MMTQTQAEQIDVTSRIAELEEEVSLMLHILAFVAWRQGGGFSIDDTKLALVPPDRDIEVIKEPMRTVVRLVPVKREEAA